MSKEIVEYKLDNDSIIFIEVTDDQIKDKNRTTAVGRKEELLQKVSDGAKKSIDIALNSIIPISNLLIDKISKIDKQPNKASVEFSIKFSLGGDIVIASLAGESNFKITLNWEKTN